jgi:hypothetical protein
MKIAHGIQDGDIPRVVLENFLILGNGVAKLALLNVSLGGSHDLGFVESEA